MKSISVILFALLCVVPFGYAAEKGEPSALPPDVVQFKERRDLCEHFRGEDAYDEERAKFIAEGIKESCTGTDRALASLRLKYKNNGAAVKALAEYEDKIEVGR